MAHRQSELVFTPCFDVIYGHSHAINKSTVAQDVIHNDDIKLDWEFKLSLLTDLVAVSNSLYAM